MRSYFSTITFVMITIALAACQSVTNQLGSNPQRQIDLARDKLKIASQHLPVIPGSTLVQTIEDIDSARQQECSSIYSNKVFAINDLSFKEVLEIYATELEAAGWSTDVTTDYGRTFKMRGLNLEVSDNYRFLPFDKGKIEAAQNTFRTLYLIAMNTSIMPDFPADKCR